MEALIAADEYCYKLGNDFYLRDFGLVLAKRYLMVFDNVRLALRTKIVTKKEDLGKFNIKVANPNIEIYPITFFQGPKQYLRHYTTISKEIKNVTKGCDCAFFRLPSTVGFAAWSIALKEHLPYAVELVYDCKDGYIQAHGIAKILWWRMHQKQISACDKALGMAPVTAQYLQKHYTPKHDIVQSYYSSIELTDNFYTSERKYPNNKPFTLVHVATQIEYNGRKGHADVLQAISILKAKGIKVNVTFIGEDYFGGIEKFEDMAKKLGVDDQVRFTGYLNYNDMRSELLNSHIAILPTKAEGLPRVLIEAMAVGLPCLASNVSGNPELIDQEFLFNFGDINAIAKQLEVLITDRRKYEEQSKKNFNRSKEYSKSILDPRRKEFYATIRDMAAEAQR